MVAAVFAVELTVDLCAGRRVSVHSVLQEKQPQAHPYGNRGIPDEERTTAKRRGAQIF
jgi:hypothetical protein